ncbi:ankyrin repeat protein [Teladorsagia circumcincta]|uniref:Ankyrin repeat protein n=1 Tax=Teladorsagia circumcincta TaxID=45464 RepID=A0A2G9V0Z6_TELCI|nr:ankyrin repeat protein [Teladorsagia circumcincta]
MEEAIAKAVEACQRGSLEALEAALQEGVVPNACDVDGCSLLHWAAINNRIPVVQRLLELGANPNVVGGLLVSSPLHWAARVGHVSSSALLIKAGAVCNVRDTQGYTPIHLAVQSNQPTLVAYLLEKFDYCKDITDNSGIELLLGDADVSLRNKQQETPLDIARNMRNQKLVGNI